ERPPFLRVLADVVSARRGQRIVDGVDAVVDEDRGHLWEAPDADTSKVDVDADPEEPVAAQPFDVNGAAVVEKVLQDQRLTPLDSLHEQVVMEDVTVGVQVPETTQPSFLAGKLV